MTLERFKKYVTDGRAIAEARVREAGVEPK
jgi:hypothetical protein